MTTINNKPLEELKALDKELSLNFAIGSSSSTTKIESLLSFFGDNCRSKTRWIEGGTQPSIRLQIKYKTQLVVTIRLSEVPACCGKLFGSQFQSYDIIYGENSIMEDGFLLKILRIFMNIVDMLTEHCCYTSFSFILSAPENRVVYRLIENFKEYRITNQFRNERMSNKNLCVEYCKNYFNNDK